MMRAPRLFNWHDLPRETVGNGFIDRCGFGGEGVIAVFNWVKPGYVPRPHQHEFEQLVLILEGECNYRVGDEVFACERGSMVRIPPHTMHCIEVTGNRAVLNLDVFAPVREDYAHLLEHQRPEWTE